MVYWLKIELGLKFYRYPLLELDQYMGQTISGPIYSIDYLPLIYWSADIRADISYGLSTAD